MYPTLLNPAAINVSDISSLPVHEFFKQTHPTDWTPSKFAAQEDSLNMQQFMQGLSVISSRGVGIINTYAGACHKYLKTDKGNVLLDSAKLDIDMRRAHEEMGKSESIYSANVRKNQFVRKSEAVHVRAKARLHQQEQEQSSISTSVASPLSQTKSDRAAHQVAPPSPAPRSFTTRTTGQLKDRGRAASASPIKSVTKKNEDESAGKEGEASSLQLNSPKYKAYQNALHLFQGSPLLPFFRYVFQKARGSEADVPQMPSNITSPNIRNLVKYAHALFTVDDDWENNIKDIYVALSCIISTTVDDTPTIFGPEIIHKINSEVKLTQLTMPVLEKILTPLQKSFRGCNYDLEFLQQEVELRLAEIVLCERDGSWSTEEEKSDLAVSRQVYQILNYFCVVINSGQFDDKNSETECVAYWSHVWRILFMKTCVVVSTGEIASVATKLDIHINETLFGIVTQSGGRKTDTLVRAKEVSGGNVCYVECSVNEHKPLHVGKATLRQQSKKVVRINRSILARSGSNGTAVYIDAHGLCGRIYGIRSIEDIYGSSSTLGKICLPSNKFEMDEFLSGASLLNLLRYRAQVVGFAKEVLLKRARDRMHTPPNSPSLKPTTPSLFTPTKKRVSEDVSSTFPGPPSLPPAVRRRLMETAQLERTETTRLEQMETAQLEQMETAQLEQMETARLKQTTENSSL
ncbi:hypothetical protein BGX26_000851 [Mortierella sp. AD094]|nr:hypothetical protein BGX26_000851 [Mortierella sp. AD094]